MANFIEYSVRILEAEEKRKKKELAFQERQKRYKEKEKNHERNII